MKSEAVDGESTVTTLDACGESSRFLPTTLSSGFAGRSGAAGNSGDNDPKSFSSVLDQHQDVQRQESGLEYKPLISEGEQLPTLSRSKCGSIDMDSHLTNSTNKLNSLKMELATKMKANFSLRCQLDDVPVQTELIQYERRFSELYAQIQEKHHLTRRQYATYNTLLEIKEFMLKEVSLLNSINLQANRAEVNCVVFRGGMKRSARQIMYLHCQALNVSYPTIEFKDAMTTPSGRSKLLDSLEVIVKGTKSKLEKAKLDLLAEQKVSDSLKEKHIIAVAEQRHFTSLLKTFQDACTEYENLRQLGST